MRSYNRAARSRLHPRCSLVAITCLVLAGLASGHPSAAALRAERTNDLRAVVVATEEAPAPRIHIAQSSGPLDGLFSIFKPKPKAQRRTDPPVSIRKSRTGSTGLPLAEGTAMLGADPDPAPILVKPAARPRVSGGSRTMCVRLCDGYYWPVNSGTHTSTIAKDRDICEQSCQVETKLFIRPSLGADAADMRDLSGKPYRKLKTAFLYRKTYLPECKCRPDPWSASEQMRHEEYRAAAAGTLVGPTVTVASAGDQDQALSEAIDASDATAADVDLATGAEASAEAADAVGVAPKIVSAPALQTVSMPVTPSTKLLPKLPSAKKSKPKSTASLTATSGGKATQPAPKQRRAAIGRTVR